MVPPVGVECVRTYGGSVEKDSRAKGEAKREKREKREEGR
jgi:hypothetical protein